MNRTQVHKNTRTESAYFCDKTSLKLDHTKKAGYDRIKMIRRCHSLWIELTYHFLGCTKAPLRQDFQAITGKLIISHSDKT